jgi:hypothetical protein
MFHNRWGAKIHLQEDGGVELDLVNDIFSEEGLSKDLYSLVLLFKAHLLHLLKNIDGTLVLVFSNPDT